MIDVPRSRSSSGRLLKKELHPIKHRVFGTRISVEDGHRMQIGISALMVVHRENSVVLSGGRGIAKKREHSMQMPGFAPHTTIFLRFKLQFLPVREHQ
jgi:hypothetical protein